MYVLWLVCVCILCVLYAYGKLVENWNCLKLFSKSEKKCDFSNINANFMKKLFVQPNQSIVFSASVDLYFRVRKWMILQFKTGSIKWHSLKQRLFSLQEIMPLTLWREQSLTVLIPATKNLKILSNSRTRWPQSVSLVIFIFLLVNGSCSREKAQVVAQWLDKSTYHFTSGLYPLYTSHYWELESFQIKRSWAVLLTWAHVIKIFFFNISLI